jgi:ABC-type branched-subunit amino acid transport system substrate-binding protein
MRDRFWSARTHYVSGRFLVLALLASGCSMIGSGVGPPASEAGPPLVIVRPGPITRDQQAEAVQLWFAAQRSFQARRYLEVLRTTSDLLSRFPASDISGEALLLSARAELEVGASDRADAAADRFIALLTTGDPRSTEMRLLQRRALASDPARQLDRLLRIDSGATSAQITEATPLVRAAADTLNLDEVLAVVEGVETDGPLRSIVEAWLAVDLLEAGLVEPAAQYARSAIDHGAGGDELVVARGVLLGELPAGRGRSTSFRVGVVLSAGGSPAMAEFSALIAEGIEVAAATVLGEGYAVSFEIRDGEGDPALSAQIVAELEAESFDAVIGLLQDETLVAAAQARTFGIPLISPTARSAARSGEGVYSLEGADPEAAVSVARYAASRAFQRVAMLYPDTPEASAEADAFESVAESLGMPVVGRFTYVPGATFFEPQIRAARDALRMTAIDALDLAEDDTLHSQVLEPVALFLPVPPEDVEFLAPQVIHFGLDTLAIELLGTSGWSDPQALDVVDARLTTGVVATQPLAGPGSGSEGEVRFAEAYEEYFQRSLVSSTPAVGYDAMLLLLEALRPGKVRPEEVFSSFSRMLEVPGATGLFSVVDGRIVRKTSVVRIDDRVPVPIEVR